MPYSPHVLRRLTPLVLLLALLSGCGGSDSTVAPVVDPLTNPDVVLFVSGRSPDSIWRYFAMNPDGSGVAPVAALASFDGRDGQGITLNQSGTLATITQTGFLTSNRSLVRLSDGVIIYQYAIQFTQRNFCANSNGTQIAVAGQPDPGDAYGIYLLKPDKSQKTQVATVPSGSTISEISFAPDDQTLYYVQAMPLPGPTVGNGVLYKLAPGLAPVALADVGTPIRSVHTSRDGTKLAFVSTVQAADESVTSFTAYTLNADGTGLTKGAVTTLSTPIPLWDIAVAGRTDGFHILYVAIANGSEEIFDVRPDGSGLRQITANAAGNGIPGTRAVRLSAYRSMGGR